MLLLGLFDCEQRLFNNFGKAYLCTISVIGTLLMQYGFLEFFVEILGWELAGVAMAYNFTFLFMFLSLIAFGR